MGVQVKEKISINLSAKIQVTSFYGDARERYTLRSPSANFKNMQHVMHFDQSELHYYLFNY